MVLSKFGKEYFLYGAESNYIDYPKRKYETLGVEIKEILNLKSSDIVLDYGCATGNLIIELQKYCICDGTDISSWAVKYGNKNFKFKNGHLFYYDKNLLQLDYNYVIFLDVLEHCQGNELNDIFSRLRKNKYLKEIVVRIPVCCKDGEDFVLQCSKDDKTHIQCHSKEWWRQFFSSYGFIIKEIVQKTRIYDSEGVLSWIIKKQEEI